MFNEGLYVVDKYRAKHYMQFFESKIIPNLNISARIS